MKHRKTRVLMLGWEFPPHNSGGLGVACRGLARALSKEGLEITFVLPKKVDLDDPEIRFLYADVDKLKTVDTALKPYISSREYDLYHDMSGSSIYSRDLFGEVMRYAATIPDVIAGEGFDMIHAHDWLSFPAGIRAKRESGKPLIVHVHATGFDQTGLNGIDERVYRIEKKAYREADRIVTVSEYTKNLIVERYGADPEKITVVHNGIDHEEYGKSDWPPLGLKKGGKKMVLYVGRLSLHKGPDHFLKAASKVLEYVPEAVFVIAGSGEMEWQLIREAAELGISDKVFFAGWVRGEELNRLYKEADLFVLPSVSEPFGITPLESVINDTPVIISRQSGVSEVISHALKVDFWDRDEMANKIIAVLRNSELGRELKDGSRKEVLDLSWKKAAQKIESLYNGLISLIKEE